MQDDNTEVKNQAKMTPLSCHKWHWYFSQVIDNNSRQVFVPPSEPLFTQDVQLVPSFPIHCVHGRGGVDTLAHPIGMKSMRNEGETSIYWQSHIFNSCLTQAWGPTATCAGKHRSGSKFKVIYYVVTSPISQWWLKIKYWSINQSWTTLL